MLSALAFGMVITFMVLIMTNRLSAMIALILVPIAFALAGGFTTGLGAMMLDGVKSLAPTGVMLIFAILYFGLMIDAGLFDPLVRAIVRVVHGDPVRILIGTAVLAMIVSLDGDGSTTYMITTAAMIPLYRRLRMDTRKMATVIILSSGMMNILPWGGPTARAMSALKLDSATVFVPLVPAMIATGVWVLFVARWLGQAERKRLGRAHVDPDTTPASGSAATDAADGPRTMGPAWLFWFNLALTLAMLVALVVGVLPLPVLFMIGFAVAMTANYPRVADQRDEIARLAANALPVAGMIFAAGIFTGILSGTKMVDAMSATVISFVPARLGPYLAPITAALSAPFTYFISNDAFYFGVLPILAEAGAQHHVPIEQIGRASLVGQQVHLLSPLVPSTYLLVGLAGIEFGELLRTTLVWALGACVVFFLACVATGAVRLAF